MIYHSIPFYTLNGLHFYAAVSQSLKQWRVFLFSRFLNAHLNMLCIFVLLVRQNPISKPFRVLSSFLLWLVSRSEYFHLFFRCSFNHFNLLVLFIGCGGLFHGKSYNFDDILRRCRFRLFFVQILCYFVSVVWRSKMQEICTYSCFGYIYFTAYCNNACLGSDL